MALIECSFYSSSIGMSTRMNVLLPEKAQGQIGMDGKTGEEPPLLYLLHGLSDDHSIWCRRTSIERYAAEKGIAVVMPNVHRSFYADMRHGYNYWTFLSEEIPAKVHEFFKISSDPHKTFVAGLSMGGYGAFKWALSRPGMFAAAGSFSGVLDLGWDIERNGALFRGREKDIELIFGQEYQFDGTENDLYVLADQAVSSGASLPKFYQSCGTEDFLYEHQGRFLSRARGLGLDIHYEESPGSHKWGYWDEQIQKFLEWIPLA